MRSRVVSNQSAATERLSEVLMSTTRDTTISVSEQEKETLDEIAEDAFGDAQAIPYGVTLSLLIDNYREST